MASCLCELHIWSLKNQYANPDEVIGCHCYHDKGEFVSRTEQPYCQEKQAYLEGRDVVWTPRNKRPERLRDNIKELEEILSQYICVQIRWRSRQVLQIVMSNAAIVTFLVSGHCGDLERIYIDKTLVGKLSSDLICDENPQRRRQQCPQKCSKEQQWLEGSYLRPKGVPAVSQEVMMEYGHLIWENPANAYIQKYGNTTSEMAVLCSQGREGWMMSSHIDWILQKCNQKTYVNEQFFIASYSSMNKLDFAYFTKRPPLNEATKRLDKLSSWEPKITQLEIPGPKGRRLERCFSINTTHEMLLVWWSLGSGEAWPWSPMNSDKERANIIIISINGPLIDVMGYAKTECDPHHVQFSGLQPHRIFSLEQQIYSQEEVIARSCTYEVIQGKIQTASIVNIPLKSTIVCQGRNPAENRMLLGLSDATLVMFDDVKRITLFTRAAVPPASIIWHPSGTLVIAASARADIQIFDQALSPLRIHLVSEDPSPERFLRISKFFRTSVMLRNLEWCPFPPFSSEFMTCNMDALFLSFSRGPVGLLQFHIGVRSRERFSCLELVKEYLKNEQVDEAVSLLGSMNWDVEGQACYACLSVIINHLLRVSLNPDREAQLQAALATFYAPKPAISEATILEYRDPISQLARRFFHHLLRYVRFDKAFLLAVDIGARDLFMDIHYMASDKGETALAEVAKKKAEQIESDDLDTLKGFDDGTFPSPSLSQNNYHNPNKRQDSFVDQLPSSRQHPWQYEYYVTQQDKKTSSHDTPSTNPQFADGSYPDRNDLRLHDHFIDDYTAALLTPGSKASRSDIHGENEEDQDDEENTEGGNVKVIHFGIV